MSQNAIVLENQKPGTPQSVWMVQPGQASSSIEGFATSMSVNIGNAVDFKINTDSTNYRIDIYRLGYYGGDGATLVTSIQHPAGSAVVQPAPLTDSATGLVDAGNWSITDSWGVPSTATSGVYIADLVRQDGTPGRNTIAFVVTDNSRPSDVLFQTSDQTWEAYNSWGGASLYDAGATKAVSYNRPMATPIGQDATTAAGPWDFVYGEEFPAIYWLEQNGYDVSYQSSVDTSSNGSLLLNHKAFLSVGHDEYWTASQRANVVAARDAGVNLNFWSGNEIFWKTELLPSIDGSGTASRTLVTYKTSATGVQNPDGVWTGTWQDPAGAGLGGYLPANELTGTLYGVDYDHVTPLNAITVPYQDAQLRIWKNTDVAALQSGQTYTTAGPYLGYEWDVMPDNGFEPAGTIALSSTTVATNALMDLTTGTTAVGSGTATHNLTLYRASSGALVFSAGSIMWTWGLSSNHTAFENGVGANAPSDPAVQQAMVNLLADEGIQPQTLQASLVVASQSTDHTSPVSTITSNGSGIYSAGQSVTVSGSASDAGGGVVAGVEVSTDGGDTWHQATLANKSATTTWSYTFSPGQTGSYAILSAAVDDSAILEHPKVFANFAVTDFLNNFSIAQGWYTADTPRMLADINGDGKDDLVGFGTAAVYVSFGQGSSAQYNGGASLSSTVPLINDLTSAQGFSTAYQRGVDFVGNFTSSPADKFATIWSEGADGFHYDVATGSTSYVDSGGQSYSVPAYGVSRSYGDFGFAQGWTQNYTIDVGFVSKKDSYASVAGFGEAGLLIGPQAFSPTANASEVYLAGGSQSLGNTAGWDSTVDVRAIRDYKGNVIDLNGDGIMDVVGMGPSGLVYALGNYTPGSTPGSNIYSLGTLQTAEVGATGSGSEFGQAQGWDNSNTLRFIADVNGDGHPDIVGFGGAGVYVSLGKTPNSDGSGAFGQAYLASPDFGTDQGWSNTLDVRTLGDVFGNGEIDIVGFGLDHTFIATPTIDAASGHVTWAMADTQTGYGSDQGFLPGQNFRGLADLGGTGAESLIASGGTSTQVLWHS
jgi:hypothetical protein